MEQVENLENIIKNTEKVISLGFEKEYYNDGTEGFSYVKEINFPKYGNVFIGTGSDDYYEIFHCVANGGSLEIEIYGFDQLEKFIAFLNNE